MSAEDRLDEQDVDVIVEKTFDVILENIGGELVRERCVARATDDMIDEIVSEKAERVIEDWSLSLGDTIRIVEVQP